jgi:hypothetical protein
VEYLQGLSPEEVNKEFARIAAEESDCSSARKGGDLGWFGRGMMQKSFEVSQSLSWQLVFFLLAQRVRLYEVQGLDSTREKALVDSV